MKELTALVKLLDEQGVEFLKHQAEVLLHNARVESVRQRAARAEEEGQAGKPAAETNGHAPEVKVESLDHNFFNISVGRSRIFFNREEMRILTKICHAAAGLSEATTRLFRWFERERKDFLNEAGIAKAGDPSLAQLYEIIVNTYKVSER